MSTGGGAGGPVGSIVSSLSPMAGNAIAAYGQNQANEYARQQQDQAFEIQRKTGLLEQDRYDQRRQDALDTQQYNQQRQQTRDRMLMALASRYGGRNFGALLSQIGGGGMPGTINRPRG